MEPRYREVKNAEIPKVVVGDGVKVRVICGSIDGTKGPVQDIVTDPEYLDISIAPKTEFKHPTTPGHTVFSYCIEGKGVFCGEKNPFSYAAEGENYFDIQRNHQIGNGSLVVFGDGEQVTVSTEDEPVRFLLISGKPIGEPVAWYGPIVMNTQEELQIAFEEYNNGTFVKKGNKKRFA
jgi:quercetin 2,3-dioxygenase